MKLVLLSVAATVGLNALLWSRGASLQGAYFMGPRVTWMLTGATSIQVLRLSPAWKAQSSPAKAVEHIGLSVVIERSKLLGAQAASQVKRRRLSAVNSRPFIKTGGKLCDPLPALPFVFGVESSTSMSWLAACFSCGMLAPVSDSQRKTVNSWADFDKQRAQLLQAAQRALPHDKELEQS